MNEDRISRRRQSNFPKNTFLNCNLFHSLKSLLYINVKYFLFLNFARLMRMFQCDEKEMFYTFEKKSLFPLLLRRWKGDSTWNFQIERKRFHSGRFWVYVNFQEIGLIKKLHMHMQIFLMIISRSGFKDASFFRLHINNSSDLCFIWAMDLSMISFHTHLLRHPFICLFVVV